MQPLPLLDFTQPWHIIPEAGRQLSAIYTSVQQIQARGGNVEVVLREAAGNWDTSALAFRRDDNAEAANEGRMWSLRDGVATINCRGPILRYSSWFSEWLGMATTQSLAYQLNEVANDSRVESVIFNFDSPGGQANGLSEMADAINALSKTKKVFAYVDGMCCSAAYWFASACEKIYTSPLGISGSIGSVMVFLDDTKAMADAGLKIVVIKSTQSPKKYPDISMREGVAQYQELVDKSAQVFGEAVARFRGIEIDDVWNKYGQGWVMTGQQAVDAGLCDGISDYETLVTELASGGGSGRSAGQSSIFAAAAAKGVNMSGNANANPAADNGGANGGQNVSVPLAMLTGLMSMIGLGGNANAAAQPAQDSAPALPAAAPPPPVQASAPTAGPDVAAMQAEIDRLRAMVDGGANTARAEFETSIKSKMNPAQQGKALELFDALAEGKAKPEHLAALVEEMEDEETAKAKVPNPVIASSKPVPSPEANADAEVSAERTAELMNATPLGQQAAAAEKGAR